MLLTIALITIGTIGMALTPSYASIGLAAPIIVIACRLVQGLALGGEVGPSTTYLIEIAPQGRRGLYGSWQLASQGIASLAAGGRTPPRRGKTAGGVTPRRDAPPVPAAPAGVFKPAVRRPPIQRASGAPAEYPAIDAATRAAASGGSPRRRPRPDPGVGWSSSSVGSTTVKPK